MLFNSKLQHNTLGPLIFLRGKKKPLGSEIPGVCVKWVPIVNNLEAAGDGTATLSMAPLSQCNKFQGQQEKREHIVVTSDTLCVQ